jgi:hypothetical protein
MISAPAKRPCDGCTACCSILNVPELDKPPYVRCRHLGNKGCTIYLDRPAAVCGAYLCEWARGLAPAWMKPSVAGVIPGHTTDGKAMHLHEVWPGASDQPQVRTFIRRANAKGIHVVVTPHPGGPVAPEALRSRAFLHNGEVRDFTGQHYAGNILVPAKPR